MPPLGVQPDPHCLARGVTTAVDAGSARASTFPAFRRYIIMVISSATRRAGLVEVTLAPGSPAINREIVELGFPRDSTVVAVLRRDHVVVPRGDTTLLEGDEVLVLVTPDSEDAVRDLLIGG